MSDERKEQEKEEQEIREFEKELSKEVVIEKDLDCITTLDHSYGFESLKRNNVHFITQYIVVLSSGNTIKFLDIREVKYRWEFPLGKGGIGAIAVHPTKKYLAVAEKSKDRPNVHIYTINVEYDSIDGIKLIPYKVLRNGTLRAFSSIAFNNRGNRLATVGSDPDYLLTIWSWEEEKIALRYKAFGQEVFNVSFSPTNDGLLTTSGVGHIKFWKMAKTFTGLKLKGQIGKFGKVDISDIPGYAELPDGKVLSGSESGNLLLWDENLIKCVFTRKGQAPCHNGMIEVIMHQGTNFITGGEDGYVRFWDFDTIDTSEPTDMNNIIEIEPKSEFKIGDDVKVANIIIGSGLWVVQDSNGALWKVNLIINEGTVRYISHLLLDFHAGGVTGVATSLYDHVAATGGKDGTIRLFDYHETKEELFISKFSSGVTKLIWSPSNVDLDGLMITAGFEDGMIRILKRCEDSFALKFVFKPHKKRVNDFSYSGDGKLLVTCSEDTTVFFFNSINYSPIGFVRLNQPAVSVLFKPNDDKVVLLLKDGTIVQMKKPVNVDTSQTYEFSPEITTLNYSQLLKENPKTEREEEKENEENKKTIGIIKGQYTPEGKLLVSLNKGLGIMEYEAKSWRENEESEFPLRSVSYRDSICTCIKHSPSGKYLLLGFKDGFVSIIDNEGKECRAMYLHDSIIGEITDISMSFDESYLLTTSKEGCFFSERINGKVPRHGVTSLKLTTRAEEEAIQDIKGSQIKSIEEAREQQEEDKKKIEAEQRKFERKRRLERLKQRFNEILKENEKREADVKLSRDEIQVDLSLKDKVLQQNKVKLEEVKKEMEWQSAKYDLALKKLKDYFIDRLDVERIELKAFKNGRTVTSFKTEKLHPDLQKEIDNVHQLINEEITKKRSLKSRGDETVITEGLHISEQSESETVEFPSPLTLKKKKSINHNTTLEKQEIFKREQEERQRLRKKLLERKPLDTEDDPEEISKILKAQQNMGDYKLKTSSDYVTPDHQRMTAEKKLRQIILLQESMHTLRMVFNVRLLGLRDLKMRLIEKFKGYNEKILDINNKLGITEKVTELELSDEEYPERRENILLSELLNDQEKGEEKAPSVISGMSKRSSARSHLKQQKDMGVKERAEQERKVRMATIRPSELELSEKEAEYQRLLYEKNRFLRKQEKQIESFDNAIDDLRREKFKLEGDLKSADLKLLLHYYELKILKEYEIKDSSKITELATKKQEKAVIQAQINECQEQLKQKKKEVQQIKKQKYLIQEFNNLVSQNHPSYAELWKLFIKNSSERDDEDNASDDYDSESDEKRDKLPQGCSEELYQQVFELQKKRMDQEKALSTIDKAAKSIKIKREGLQKQETTIIKELTKIEELIRETQREKQHKLNELETIVVLKFNQIISLAQNKIPADLSDQIVFTNKYLLQLASRIKELGEYRNVLRREYVELQKNQRTKLKEQKGLEEKYQTEKQKVREVQMLKFGREVNLEELENAKIDKGAEELKLELHEKEKQSTKIMKEWDDKITEYKQTMIQITSENTQLLNKLAELRKAQEELEHELEVSQTTLIARTEKTLEKTNSNSEQLKSKIIEQNKQIEAIKSDIALLSFKSASLILEQE
ncbi:hypothetical protein ABK040_014742 [Willaertia magna]